MPIIPATQEVKVGRSRVQGQLGKAIETLLQKQKGKKKTEGLGS
jgi:hypothetical protein